MANYSDMFMEAHANAGLCSCGCWYHGGDCLYLDPEPDDHLYFCEECGEFSGPPPADLRADDPRVTVATCSDCWRKPAPDAALAEIESLTEEEALILSHHGGAALREHQQRSEEFWKTPIAEYDDPFMDP